jgi:uncharacterized membrane protein
MAEEFNASPMEPSQDERTMAVLAQVLQVVGWWIAPLIILLVKRESRFVRFHALQALLLQGVYVIVSGVFVVIWFGAFFLTMSRHSGGSNTAPPPAFFVLFPLIWLGFMGLWVAVLAIAILYASRLDVANGRNILCLGRFRERF